MVYPISLGQKILEVDLPDKYREDDFMQQLCNALGAELEQLDRWLHVDSLQDYNQVLLGNYLYDHEGILAQWFSRTVTGSYLVWWENMLGIATDTTLSDTDRRNNIRGKMAQRANAPTLDYLKAQVERYVIQAAIIPNISGYSFVVRIILPRALIPATVQSNITSAIEAAKPAHLAYTIQFTESDWSGLANRDWATIGNMDWATINY